MDDLQKIKEIKELYNMVYDGCANKDTANKAIMKSDLVTGGFITDEDGAAIVIFAGDYIFLTEENTIYKIYKEEK